MKLAYNDLTTVQCKWVGEDYELTMDASAFSLPDSAAKLVLSVTDGAGRSQTITRITPLSSASFVNVAEGSGNGIITAQDAKGNTLGSPFAFHFDMEPYETDSGTLIVKLSAPTH